MIPGPTPANDERPAKAGRLFLYRRRTAETAHAARNSARFGATTVAPTGVDQANDTVSPAQKHATDVTAAQRVTPRKL